MPMYRKKLGFSDDIRDFFQDVDYLVANFEGVLYEEEKSPFVLLAQRHNRQILTDLKELLPASKIILSLGNNHGADFGFKTFIHTKTVLEEMGFRVVGGRGFESLYLNDDIKLVAATEWSNQSHGYLSFLERAQVFYDDQCFSILYPHWGHEMEYWPRQTFKDQALEHLKRWDLIIGHHSHLPGLINSYPHDKGEKLLAYSLGDSASAVPRRRYRFGMMTKVSIGQNSASQWLVGQGSWRYTHLKSQEKEMVLHTISEPEYLEKRL